MEILDLNTEKKKNNPKCKHIKIMVLIGWLSVWFHILI